MREGRSDMAFIRLRDVRKTYSTLDRQIQAADGVDLDIEEGSLTALIGPSGSGKSTLLHLIGALDEPNSGTIEVASQSIVGLRPKAQAAYRRRVGFIFQRYNLLPALTVIDNVIAPVLPYKTTFDPRARARELLEAVGIRDRDHTLATRLSGGQQQRVAIARALMNEPRLVLADEPTGNLDSDTGNEIVDLLVSLRDTRGVTLVIATHDEQLAKRCDVIVAVRDGRIVGSE
jgi:putative ABC transport system ATP-binding protein